MTSYRDWVVEQSNTTGTVAYVLGGAPAGTSYFTFRQRYSDGEDEVIYWVISKDRSKWEKNRFGTLNYGADDSLTRAVVESTNGDAPVPWTSDDLPLLVYVVPDSDAADGPIRGWLGAARSAVLLFGSWFKKDDPASGKHLWNIYDGANDIPIGIVDAVQHKVTSYFTPCGMVVPYVGSSAPTGWVLASGLTIGSAASGATGRDHADTLDLYTLLWNSLGNAYAVVSGGRGASAAADFAANKTIALPDLSGRVVVGQDDMSGTSRNNITIFDGDILGNTGGSQTNNTTMSSTGSTSGALSVTTGSNGMDGPTSTSGVNNGSDFQAATSVHIHNNVTATGNTSGSLSVGVSGTSASFGIVQPSIVLNYIIKL